MPRSVLVLIPTILRVEMPDEQPLHVLDIETHLNGLYRHPSAGGAAVTPGMPLGEGLTANAVTFERPKVLEAKDQFGQVVYDATKDDPRI